MPSQLVACQTKKGHYYSYAAASEGAERLFRDKREITYPYKCPYCKLFHIGHPPQPVTAKPDDWDKTDRTSRQQDLDRAKSLERYIHNESRRDAKKAEWLKRQAEGLAKLEENNRKQAEYSAKLKEEKRLAKLSKAPAQAVPPRIAKDIQDRKEVQYDKYWHQRWADDGGMIWQVVVERSEIQNYQGWRK